MPEEQTLVVSEAESSTSSGPVRSRRAKAILGGVGLIAGLLGLVPLYVRLNASQMAVASLVVAFVTLFFLRALVLWVRGKLDVWLTMLTIAIVGVTVVPLYRLTQDQDRHSQQAQGPDRQPTPPTPSASPSMKPTYLDELPAVEMPKWESVPYTSNGKPANHTFAVYPCRRAKSPATQTFVLNGQYDSFYTTVVPSASSKSTQSMSYAVYLDGNELRRTSGMSTAPYSFSLSVTNGTSWYLLVTSRSIRAVAAPATRKSFGLTRNSNADRRSRFCLPAALALS